MILLNDIERKELSEIIKASLTGEKKVFSKSVDYEKILEAMDVHTILTMAMPMISEFPIEHEIKEKYKNRMLQITVHNVQIAHEEHRVISMLEDESIPCVIIKGSAFSQYYPSMEMRMRGDIDLVVEEDLLDHAIDLLIQDGYQIMDSYFHHTELVKNGVEVELHRHTYSDPDMMLSGLKNRIFKGIPVMPDRENGFLMLNHIKFHIKTGIGLRHLIDWFLYVEKVCNDEYWNTEFFDIVSQHGMTNLAKSLTMLGKEYFGLCSGVTWCDDASMSDCKMLYEHILNSGNFYRNHTSTSRKVNTVLCKGLRFLLRRLQSDGETNFSAFKNHKFLMHFVWMFQIFIYAKDFMQENGMRGLFDFFLKTNYRKKIRKMWIRLSV